MDSKAIETISVNAVRNSVVMSELLDQFIPDNDKEPSWDGCVYIYGDKSKKKSSLKGRMPVQIKGKICNDHPKKIAYSMSTADLKNYLNDGGCILFVVYIQKFDYSTTIYYAELTPIKLRNLLEKGKKQNTKTVHLKIFPSESNDKTTIFLNCLQNCQKQASFIEGKLPDLEELKSQGVLKNIVIPVATVRGVDPEIALLKSEVYIYAEIKGSTIVQPIDFIPQDIHTMETKKALVTIQDRAFYTQYKVIKSAEKVVFKYGDSFTLTFEEDNQSCKINYKDSNKIRVLAKDLDFMISYLENGYFKVNDVKIPFDYNEKEISGFSIIKEKEYLCFAKKVVKTLDLLGCSEDLDISNLKDEGLRNLNYLITAFVDKKPVKGLKNDLPSIACIKVGKLRFAVCLEKCEEAGTYEISNFFETDFPIAIQDETDKKKMLPISQFALLETNDLLTLSNIKYDILLPSFKKTQHHQETFSRANWFLLDLLSAYDSAEGMRKKMLLKTCLDFSEWISEAPQNELDNQIRTLNRLQTIKRARTLNSCEIQVLWEIVEDSNTTEECKVGAYLLLEQQVPAERHFAKLTNQEKGRFQKYPIYHFWKEKNL